ncbi:MAG: GlcG/HbpS family heme-binding protein [Ktedonobacteraceae bacterium]
MEYNTVEKNLCNTKFPRNQTTRRKDISMAENTFQKSSITIEAAERIIKAAEKKAQEMGKPMCIAICDEDGTLKAFRRMDGAPLLSVQIAQDKAYTAISFGGMATHEWYEFIKNDPPLLNGIVKTDRLIVFGGGFAIKNDAGIIGGIGVSGGHYTDDMQVAQAGLEAL